MFRWAVVMIHWLLQLKSTDGEWVITDSLPVTVEVERWGVSHNKASRCCLKVPRPDRIAKTCDGKLVWGKSIPALLLVFCLFLFFVAQNKRWCLETRKHVRICIAPSCRQCTRRKNESLRSTLLRAEDAFKRWQVVIIMCIDHALINALGAHMIHIDLHMTFYTHVGHSPTKTIYIKYYKKYKIK